MEKKQLTTYQKVERLLNGISNEEAEDVAVKILAQILAKHFYVMEDGKEYLLSLNEKLLSETKEFVKKYSFMIAISKVVNDKEKEKSKRQ